MRTSRFRRLNDPHSPTPGPEPQITAHRTRHLSFLVPSLFQMLPKSPNPNPMTSLTHLFLWALVLRICFCLGSSHHQPIFTWSLGWKFQGRRPSRCGQSLMSTTYGFFPMKPEWELPLSWGLPTTSEQLSGGLGPLCHWPRASPDWEMKPHRSLSVFFLYYHQVP